MAHDVFVSYSSPDKPVADALCASFEREGIRVWIAPRDILPGKLWGEAIIDAINASKLMIVVFSSNSNNSNQVLREVERAVSKGVAIIPFRIENVVPSKSMEYFLSSPHWLDALTPPLEKHAQKLTNIANLLLSNQFALDQLAETDKPPAKVASTATTAGKQTSSEDVSLDDWYKRKKDTIWNTVLSLFDEK